MHTHRSWWLAVIVLFLSAQCTFKTVESRHLKEDTQLQAHRRSNAILQSLAGSWRDTVTHMSRRALLQDAGGTSFAEAAVDNTATVEPSTTESESEPDSDDDESEFDDDDDRQTQTTEGPPETRSSGVQNTSTTASDDAEDCIGNASCPMDATFNRIFVQSCDGLDGMSCASNLKLTAGLQILGVVQILKTPEFWKCQIAGKFCFLEFVCILLCFSYARVCYNTAPFGGEVTLLNCFPQRSC